MTSSCASSWHGSTACWKHTPPHSRWAAGNLQLLPFSECGSGCRGVALGRDDQLPASSPLKPLDAAMCGASPAFSMPSSLARAAWTPRDSAPLLPGPLPALALQGGGRRGAVADYERAGELKFGLLVWRANLRRDASLAEDPQAGSHRGHPCTGQLGGGCARALCRAPPGASASAASAACAGGVVPSAVPTIHAAAAS